MSNSDQTPIKLATVELLTQEIAFQNPQKVVAEINDFHSKNIKYDREYYELVGASPSVDENTIDALLQVLERHFQQAGSMEYHALVRAPSSEESIPRIGDAILLRNQLLRALDVVRDIIQYKEAAPDKQHYLEYFLQRWIYKFCRHIFDSGDMKDKLIALFEPEQKKGKEGFKSLFPIIEYLSTEHNAANAPGYDPANMRRLYVIFGNLLFAYLREGIPIPFHLQRIFVEFQKNKFFDYEQLSEESEPIHAERGCLLIPLDNVKPFFMQFKEIKSPMKKSVLIGILVEPERKFIVEHFCKLGIRGAGEMYKFIGNKLSVAQITEAQGRDWLINAYDTITKVVEEQKILQNTQIPESIRELFGNPINLPTPAFRQEKEKKGIVLSPEMVERMQSQQAEATPVTTVEVEPEVIDIPNLVAANNLEELEDKGRTKSIVIVQDANVLDLIVKNWEIRGDLTFPELVEFIRIPFQVFQSKAPGIREGRKFVSFAYLIALGLSEEHIQQFVDKLGETQQVSKERVDQLQRLYPIALKNIGELQKLNKDARPLLGVQGNIIPHIFLEKCETLQKIFMEKFSYIQSLLSYWIIVEEIYYTIAKNIAGLAEIQAPTPSEVEKFVASQNETYMGIYEKALTFAGPLKTYFKKKYNPELQHHFVNVKIKNDLLKFAETVPINLAER